MNYHVFLDIVAWVFGVVFTILFITASAVRKNKEKYLAEGRYVPFGRWLLFFVVSTTCWAWIIAG